MKTDVSKSPIVSIVFILLLIASFMGCSTDKSPTSSEETYFLTVTFGSLSSRINLDDYPKFTIEGVSTVRLSDLVDTTIVTEPNNYAYRFIGQDGFYTHLKGNPDNIWEHLHSGYILLKEMKVSFDPSLNLPSRYNIKDVAEMRILRKIDFVTPADSLFQYIVDEMQTSTFEDSLTAIALEEFIPADALSDPSAYSYILRASDDYSVTISFNQLKTGYFISSSDRILYSNPDISGKLKVKKLNRITAVTSSD